MELNLFKSFSGFIEFKHEDSSLAFIDLTQQQGAWEPQDIKKRVKKTIFSVKPIS